MKDYEGIDPNAQPDLPDPDEVREWTDAIGSVIAFDGPARADALLGAAVDAATYLRSWRKLREIRARWAETAKPFDAVLIPSAPILPPNTERLMNDHDYFVTENLLALRNTRIGNLLGLSALTLPTATPSCGLMMMGKPFGEAALCRLGAAAEAVVAG